MLISEYRQLTTPSKLHYIGRQYYDPESNYWLPYSRDSEETTDAQSLMPALLTLIEATCEDNDEWKLVEAYIFGCLATDFEHMEWEHNQIGESQHESLIPSVLHPDFLIWTRYDMTKEEYTDLPAIERKFLELVRDREIDTLHPHASALAEIALM